MILTPYLNNKSSRSNPLSNAVYSAWLRFKLSNSAYNLSIHQMTFPPCIMYWSIFNLSSSVNAFVGLTMIIASIIDASGKPFFKSNTAKRYWFLKLSPRSFTFKSMGSPFPIAYAIVGMFLRVNWSMALANLYSNKASAALRVASISSCGSSVSTLYCLKIFLLLLKSTAIGF